MTNLVVLMVEYYSFKIGLHCCERRLNERAPCHMRKTGIINRVLSTTLVYSVVLLPCTYDYYKSYRVYTKSRKGVAVVRFRLTKILLQTSHSFETHFPISGLLEGLQFNYILAFDWNPRSYYYSYTWCVG